MFGTYNKVLVEVIFLLDSMQGWLALATSVRYVAETHARNIASAFMELIDTCGMFKEMYHSCLREFLAGIDKAVGDFEDKHIVINSESLKHFFIIYTSTDPGIVAAIKDMRKAYEYSEELTDWRALMDPAADGQGSNFDKFLKYLLRHEDQYHSHKFGLLPLSHADAMIKRNRDRSNATRGRSHLAITAGGNANENATDSTSQASRLAECPFAQSAMDSTATLPGDVYLMTMPRELLRCLMPW